jgi:glycosyltransferase involved in cell wall biosynthesis
MLKNKKILFIQRVITGYRLDLLKLLCNDFLEVGIITSKGDDVGTLKLAKYKEIETEISNLNIHKVPSLRLGYKGESRSTNFFIYPKALSILKKYDIIVLEGTTNLLNNIYLLPYAKLLKKKTIWWDAGYSLPNRTYKRKLIDFIVKPFVKMTDAQMAYSTLAKEYLTKYMGAKNAFLNLNTINTSYFKSISDEISKSIQNYVFDKSDIKLLYVGVVEKRKKVKELIDIVLELNKNATERTFSLTIIGGGSQLEELNTNYSKQQNISILGPIYDKDKLKDYYFNSDLFVLPGDGGLAILQSLLYGLPVLSIKGADGTEIDYINNSYYLMNSVLDLPTKLKGLKSVNRGELLIDFNKISSDKWKNLLTNTIKSICDENIN